MLPNILKERSVDVSQNREANVVEEFRRISDSVLSTGTALRRFRVRINSNKKKCGGKKTGRFRVGKAMLIFGGTGMTK